MCGFVHERFDWTHFDWKSRFHQQVRSAGYTLTWIFSADVTSSSLCTNGFSISTDGDALPGLDNFVGDDDDDDVVVVMLLFLLLLSGGGGGGGAIVVGRWCVDGGLRLGSMDIIRSADDAAAAAIVRSRFF